MAYTTEADTFQKQIAAARAYAGSRPVWAGIGAYQLSPGADADAHRRRQQARRRRHHPVLVRGPRRAAQQRRLGQRTRPRRIRHRSGVSCPACRSPGSTISSSASISLAITAFGSWFARYQKTTRDYFLTDRSVPWWAICFTIVATETSTLTFIGIPAQAYAGQHDVPAAGHRLRHRPRHRQRPLHPRVLPGRSLHVVRTAAAPLRHARQDAVGGDLPDHALARRRHPPVHDRAGDLDRHAGAGHRGW